MMMSCAFGGLWRLALDVSNQHQVSCAVRRRPRVFKVHATRDDASYMTKKLLRKSLQCLYRWLVKHEICSCLIEPGCTLGRC